MKIIDFNGLSDINKAMFVQDIVCDLLGVDLMPLTGDEMGGRVSEGAISCPAQPLTRDCVGLEVLFYSPFDCEECLHRGVVVDYDDGIVDVEWRSAVVGCVGGIEGAQFESSLHMYEACAVAVVQ